jgi:APA family basic amino acid/polyamine antiporter
MADGAPHEPNAGGDVVRRLGTVDAVVLGLSSMVGAGVFAVFAPAAAAAGSGALIGLGVAGIVAHCNARSSAAIAALHPESGGAYVYGRLRLGDWWGFTAGWGFVLGKTASCAAMALTFASYAAPEHVSALAAAAVAAFTAVNCFGVTKTAGVARVLLALTLLALVVVLGAALGGGVLDVRHLAEPARSGGVRGILESAGMVFFAFAGYARIATLGGEVRQPRRTIPRAIPLALAIALVLYAAVGIAVLLALGPERLATSAAPLADAVRAGDFAELAPVAGAGAAVASLGALLALMTGIGRTVLAMARHRDLPRWLGAVHAQHHVPHRAEIVLGVVVCGLVLAVDLRSAIGFSSFGVLVYYAIANAAALTLTRQERGFPRWPAALGLAGCVLLATTLPSTAVLAGLGVLALGLVGRALVHFWRARIAGR